MGTLAWQAQVGSQWIVRQRVAAISSRYRNENPDALPLDSGTEHEWLSRSIVEWAPTPSVSMDAAGTGAGVHQSRRVGGLSAEHAACRSRTCRTMARRRWPAGTSTRAGHRTAASPLAGGVRGDRVLDLETFVGGWAQAQVALSSDFALTAAVSRHGQSPDVLQRFGPAGTADLAVRDGHARRRRTGLAARAVGTGDQPVRQARGRRPRHAGAPVPAHARRHPRRWQPPSAVGERVDGSCARRRTPPAAAVGRRGAGSPVVGMDRLRLRRHDIRERARSGVSRRIRSAPSRHGLDDRAAGRALGRGRHRARRDELAVRRLVRGSRRGPDLPLVRAQRPAPARLRAARSPRALPRAAAARPAAACLPRRSTPPTGPTTARSAPPSTSARSPSAGSPRSNSRSSPPSASRTSFEAAYGLQPAAYGLRLTAADEPRATAYATCAATNANAERRTP